MKRLLISLLVLTLFIQGQLRGQTVLTVTGEVAQPLTLQAADLKALPHTNVTAIDRDGKEHRYSGVRCQTCSNALGFR